MHLKKLLKINWDTLLVPQTILIKFLDAICCYQDPVHVHATESDNLYCNENNE